VTRTAIRPKLVAFDLDGTLLGEEPLLRPRVVEAIAAMRARGIEGCIVTGRMYRAALPFARQLHFEAPIICYQGAAVIDPDTDEVLLDTPLPNALALEMTEYARQANLHIQLYANDRYYCEERNRHSDLYARLSGVEPIVVPSLEEQFRFSDATKACIIADTGVVELHLPVLKARFEGRAYVTRSFPWFIEGMNVNVHKGRALEVVTRRLGVTPGDVVAIGDSWNDAPLLEAAGFGIAMGSAPPELRAVADAVVGDVANDGVAEALERYVLTPE